MVDEEAVQLEETEGAEEVGFSENKTTLAYKLAHPEENPMFKSAPEPEAKAEEPETQPEVAAEAAPEPVQEGAPSPEPEPPKYKFESLDEYDKAYKAAVAKMHESTTETEKERKAREELEAKVAEMERQMAEAARPKPLSDDEKDAIYANAAKELSELDQTDPDYLKNYGRTLRKAVEASTRNSPVDPTLTAEEIYNKAWEKIQAKQAEEANKTAEQRQADENARIETKARELGAKAGLDLSDPDSADAIIWDRMKGKIPQEVYDKGTLETQVEWVAAEVRKRTGKVVQQTDEERRLAQIAQKNNAVLGKGVTIQPTSSEPPKRRTLNDMYAERASRGERL